jgi:hypothetical protein
MKASCPNTMKSKSCANYLLIKTVTYSLKKLDFPSRISLPKLIFFARLASRGYFLEGARKCQTFGKSSRPIMMT